MIKKNFSIQINASSDRVYDVMLGISNIKTYENWTATFNPTSTYIGNWQKDSTVYFIGTDENGKRGGMISKIAENIPNRLVSIQHYGILDGENEITSGKEVEQWAGCMEIYYFKSEDKNTILTVELDVVEDHLEYFETTYPKALQKLKEIVEN